MNKAAKRKLRACCQRQRRAAEREVSEYKNALNEARAQIAVMRSHEDALQAKLIKQRETWQEELGHTMARTELIKAMSWAMKACSSIMWSEKQVGWNFQTPQPPKSVR